MGVTRFKRPLSYMLEPFDVADVKQLAQALAFIIDACASMKPTPDVEEAMAELKGLANSLDQFVTLLEKWQ